MEQAFCTCDWQRDGDGHRLGCAIWRKPRQEPIWIACEGSRCPTHWRDHNEGICQMCGQLVRTGGDGRAANHQRRDVVAMLDRGDFG